MSVVCRDWFTGPKRRACNCVFLCQVTNGDLFGTCGPHCLEPEQSARSGLHCCCFCVMTRRTWTNTSTCSRQGSVMLGVRAVSLEPDRLVKVRLLTSASRFMSRTVLVSKICPPRSLDRTSIRHGLNLAIHLRQRWLDCRHLESLSRRDPPPEHGTTRVWMCMTLPTLMRLAIHFAVDESMYTLT